MMKSNGPLILNEWSVETPRYPAWMQGVWQSHPRHADLKKVSRQKAPKHPELLGRAIRHAPHREAFIPDVKILGFQNRLAELHEHTDLGRSHVQGTQLGWQGHSYT
jgi:hypothetical protein